MSSTLTEERIELTELASTERVSLTARRTDTIRNPDEVPEDAANITTAIPDGGHGWVVIFCCSVTAFWSNGVINCWGVLQAALIDSSLRSVPTATVSWVGSLGLALSAFLGIFVVQLMRWAGSRRTSMAGVCLMGASLISSGFCTGEVRALFGTMGILAGLGMSMVYTVSNGLPVQYFSGHLGLANGIVKLGGGIGGCVLAIAIEAMYRRVGIAWTFRIQGLVTLATGLPAAWMQKDRVRMRSVPLVDISMFRSIPFVTIFLAGAIGSFSLFVPPYFLPLFAQSINLTPSTGAGLVAAFNLCNAVGRFAAGPLCDKIGPVNMFLITMIVNGTSMLAIWPVSDSLGPLAVFAALNGAANGSFFTTLPTVVASMFGPGRAAVAMSMAVAGWSGGYLMGSPTAGYLLQAAGGKQQGGQGLGIEVYRPAIFYAGGVAIASSLFVLLARFKMAKKLVERV